MCVYLISMCKCSFKLFLSVFNYLCASCNFCLIETDCRALHMISTESVLFANFKRTNINFLPKRELCVQMSLFFSTLHDNFLSLSLLKNFYKVPKT